MKSRTDRLGLLPTRDPYQILRLMGTNGWNYGLGPEEVAAGLKDIERDHPFRLTGIGFDFAEGRFLGPVADPKALARRLCKFCPDVVDQGTGSVAALARQLRATGTFILWWD